MGKAKTRPRDDHRPGRRDERPGHRGADARTRTGNLPITSRLRCQLRHAGGSADTIGPPASERPDSTRSADISRRPPAPRPRGDPPPCVVLAAGRCPRPWHVAAGAWRSRSGLGPRPAAEALGPQGWRGLTRRAAHRPHVPPRRPSTAPNSFERKPGSTGARRTPPAAAWSVAVARLSGTLAATRLPRSPSSTSRRPIGDGRLGGNAPPRLTRPASAGSGVGIGLER